MLLSDCIDNYLADRRSRGLAASTIRSQKGTLKLLLADAGNIETKRLKPQHLDAFWANRHTWGPATRNRAAHTLNIFFAWCRVRGYLPRDYDPMEGSRKERVPPRDRVLIPQSEFSILLEQCEDPRKRIAVALGLYLFLRVSDAEALRWQDVNFDTATVEVYRPKTRTLDTLPICDELMAELRRWKLAYAARVGEPVQKGWFLIPGLPAKGGQRGRKGIKGFVEVLERPYLPTTKANLGYAIRTILQAAGYYRPQEGGHTLRRSGATALYNQLSSVGHDRAIRICQAMLGHSSVQTTEIYLRLDLDRKVRNDLLAGKRMFPEEGTATVLRLGGTGIDGPEDVDRVRV
jgi:integrase